MATDLRIKAELGRAATLYRHSLTGSELGVIAGAWQVAFALVGDAEFARAMQAHLEKSRYFPTIADIKTALAGLTPNRPPLFEGVAALPAGRTPQAATVALAFVQGKIGRRQADDFFHKERAEQQELTQKMEQGRGPGAGSGKAVGPGARAKGESDGRAGGQGPRVRVTGGGGVRTHNTGSAGE